MDGMDDQRFFDAVTLLPFSFRDRAEMAAKQNVAASYARAAIDSDQELWRVAQESPGFLSSPRPASSWSPKRCRIVEQTYGHSAEIYRHQLEDLSAALNAETCARKQLPRYVASSTGSLPGRP